MFFFVSRCLCPNVRNVTTDKSSSRTLTMFCGNCADTWQQAAPSFFSFIGHVELKTTACEPIFSLDCCVHKPWSMLKFLKVFGAKKNIQTTRHLLKTRSLLTGFLRCTSTYVHVKVYTHVLYLCTYSNMNCVGILILAMKKVLSWVFFLKPWI